MRCIAYKSGYKYQLEQDYVVDTGIVPPAPVHHSYYALDQHGRLTVRRSYAWGGPSGPTIDTPSFMRGALVHDALYQMMRDGHLNPRENFRDQADALLRDLCREDGMTAIGAWLVYKAVKYFAGDAANPASGKKLEHAPRGCP
ncbi:MAG: hypothetical protein ABL951_01945 [Alphaproteobacteria bacterium]